MPVRAIVHDKYYLRDLHSEIDLFDRKLVHLQNHEVFETQELRDAAVRKMTTRRNNLAETARTLAATGIEFLPSELPRSFREATDKPSTRRKSTKEKAPPASSSEAPAQPESSATSSEGFDQTPSQFGEQIARLQSMQQVDPQADPKTDPSPLASWQQDLEIYKRRRQKLQTAAAKLAS